MMRPIRIATLIGTRPEIIRLSQTIKELDARDEIVHTLIHTGQNYDYELNQIFFDDLELRAPDVYLNAAAVTPSATIGHVLIKLDEWLANNPIDAFLVLGDTNSALGAIAAKKRKIPVFHCEAGNRSFDERVPEETNRRIVDHFADINLPYSRHARQYLIAEGLPEDKIVLSGSPMKEVLQANEAKIERSPILNTLKIEPKEYFLVSAHREENVSNQTELLKLTHTLNQLAKDYQLPIIVSTHPRTKKELDRAGVKLHSLIRLLKPMNYSDYVKLQLNAYCVLSDSGTISEECAILGFPAVNIRYSQERPEAFELGVLPLVGLEYQDVSTGIELVTQRLDAPPIPVDYQSADFSSRVIYAIIAYIKNNA
jgi:UDP-N-acetylglucosamine 2-epimerase (non-hydrolysing)